MMIRNLLLALLLCSCAPLAAQTSLGGSGRAGGTSVSSGAYSAVPATCAVGAVYIITSGVFDQAICTSANTWTFYYEHRAITPFAKMTLSTAGTSGPTVSTTQGYQNWTLPVSGSSNFWFNYWTPPTAPYTVTIALRGIWGDVTNYRQIFAGWGDLVAGWEGLNCGSGTTTPFNGNGGACRVSKFGTNGSYGSDATAGVAFEGGMNGLKYVKLKNDGTNLTIFGCSDYDVCLQIGASFGTTSYLTSGPLYIGFSAENNAGNYPWAMTFVGIE